MTEEWLIDGYNLLHDFAADKKGGKSMSREKLFSLLASFAASQDKSMLMVLDGKGKAEEFLSYQTDHFRIKYSQEVTADAAIEKILCEKRGSVSFMVVTNDRAITQVARGGGSRVMACKEFADLLIKTSKAGGDILFKEEIRAHGFNRPFDKLL